MLTCRCLYPRDTIIPSSSCACVLYMVDLVLDRQWAGIALCSPERKVGRLILTMHCTKMQTLYKMHCTKLRRELWCSKLALRHVGEADLARHCVCIQNSDQHLVRIKEDAMLV